MELLDDLKLYINMNTKSFSLNCKRVVQNKFVAVWNNNLKDSHTNPPYYAPIEYLKVILILNCTYIDRL